MACRVGIHLVPLVAFQVIALEPAGAQAQRLFVRGLRVPDVEVQVHLLRRTVRPVRRNVVGRELHADPPLTDRVDDAVKGLVCKDLPIEHSRPERTLSMHVSSVEHGHASYRIHDGES